MISFPKHLYFNLDCVQSISLVYLCIFCRHPQYSWLEGKFMLRSGGQIVVASLEEEVCASTLLSLSLSLSKLLF